MTAIAKSAKKHPTVKKCRGREERAICGPEAISSFKLWISEQISTEHMLHGQLLPGQLSPGKMQTGI